MEVKHTVVLNYKGLEHLPVSLLTEPVCDVIRRLYLKRNRLTSLPMDIGRLTHLVDLYLHSNEIEVLPDSIGTLHSLEILNVGNNRLTEIPESLCKLVNLRKLCLSNNNLKYLPSSIGNLAKLENLEVTRNEITVLPAEISRLSNLKNLGLDTNKLKMLPRQLHRLKNINDLSVCGNDLLYLPQDIGMTIPLHLYVDNNQCLNCIPFGLLTSDVGLHNCGIFLPSEDVLEYLKHLRISYTDSKVDDIILLPAEIRLVGNFSDKSVSTLLELSLRKVYSAIDVSKMLQDEEAPINHVIPKDLISHLQDPTAHCVNCRTEIFVMGYPFLCPLSEGRLQNMFRLGFCCSCNCLKHFLSSNVTTKFLYPRLEDLSMALVLA